MTVRKAIEVAGIVQGVGFRPYIYRLATERNLTGFITNTAAGVSIEVEGPPAVVEDFLVQLPREAPRLARITQVVVSEIPSNHETVFRILPSRVGEERRALISPDVALCEDCLHELFAPADRRFRYPFINCTNCGPRYTIVRDIPYDRARTSMAVFPMCPECQREYDDPLNRRFHAQPNACWKCGPMVEQWEADGQRVKTPDPIAEAVARLEAGAVLAVKGLGGFHLAVNATDTEAVARLRARKRRVEKPFAVMAADLESIAQFCWLDEATCKVLQSPERPIVLLRKKRFDFAHRPELVEGQPNPIAEAVAPFNRDLGVFLPYTPLHHLIFAGGRFLALVMTSGNISEEPIAIDNAEALARLRGIADFFLVHNREILLRCDDSVVRNVGGRLCQARRSRGYVPAPVFLHGEVPLVLAVGGELKNTLCLTKGRHAFLSQHIGDLENLESYRFFEETVASLKRILEVEPRILAYDLHPDYFSTRWALAQPGMERVGVQHHHAHIASCMAENHLEGRVIGFALDGTGYGSDGQVWGGEVLVATYRDFERVAHLDYVSMPGSAAAIHEPWRMAVSYLAKHFGRGFLEIDIPFVRQLDRRRVEVLLRMLDHKVNSPLTSSCGRLFDAVAALAGIRQVVNYEAQAAMELEAALPDRGTGAPPVHGQDGSVRRPTSPLSPEEDVAYPFEIRDAENGWIIETRPLFAALVRDLRDAVPVSLISQRFHRGLVDVLADLARLVHERTGLDRVCLSGGSFQNVYLLEGLTRKLEAGGFNVFTHAEVPCGDGGLSLGQALVAAHRVEGEDSECV